MRTIRGFTLVEILIVVSILGIMAAIVIPQYNSSTGEARLAALRSNLHAVRKQLELYKIHHNGVWPAFLGETSADFTRRMATEDRCRRRRRHSVRSVSRACAHQ